MSIETIHINGIDTPVSRVGLGTWAIGCWMWGGADDAQMTFPASDPVAVSAQR